MRDAPRPGDRVQVRFGGYVSDAVVQYVSDFGSGLIASIEIHIEDSDEPIPAMYHIEDIEPAAPAA